MSQQSDDGPDRLSVTERMAFAHTGVQTPPFGERRSFTPTTDLRATSDPLWRTLHEFRRRLIDGGCWDVMQWRNLLFEARLLADKAGLKARMSGDQPIAMTAAEAIEADPLGFDAEMLDEGWSWIVLVDEGPAGWIQDHDLCKGFTEYPLQAIRWAESWMLARERQLVGLAIETPTGGMASSAKPIADDLRTARWFADATGPDGLYAELLKAARRAGKLPSSEKPHNHWLYSASEVAGNWGEYRGRIMDKLADEAETNGNGR